MTDSNTASHASFFWTRTSPLKAAALALTLCGASLVSAAAAAAPLPALQAVPSIDLSRYQGQWYQIAYYPNTFQKQCVANTTATYKPLANGQIEVTNQCKTADGTLSTAVGAARVKPPKFLGVPVAKGTVTSKLEVRFAPSYLSWINAVWAPYWVIQLADDYRYAVIGEPNRDYLWILSRTPTLDLQDRAIITGLLQQQGYDPTKLQEEPQGK
jgi:apolipoprotein D and lipocalin family protein